MSFRLTRKAAEDVRRIYREGERIFGQRQAQEYHRHLQHIFQMLGENPKLARERMEITPPVRIHPCGSHLVVYMERDLNEILVIRVRHYRENW